MLTAKDVKELVWNLFEGSGLTQYYALYQALRHSEEEERREKFKRRR